MIETIFVTAQTKVEDLRKIFRKKLMTGGAILRLGQGLSSGELEQIFQNFESSYDNPHGISSMVFRQLAQHDQITSELTEKLKKLKDFYVIQKLSDKSQSPNFSSKGLTRKYFLSNLGPTKENIQARILLASNSLNLPADLKLLLKRDPNPKVRFAFKLSSSFQCSPTSRS